MKRSITYAAIGFGLLLPYLSQPAFSQTIPTADTKNAGPAAAAIEGITYVAWKGKSTPSDSIYYSTDESAGTQISFAKTTQAPALTTFGSTLYLAWRGQSSDTTDDVYYSTNTGSGWSPQTKVCGPGQTPCAVTTAAPALAASSSTLYAAWTTSSNTIQYATFSGSWTFPTAQPPAVPVVPGTSPALAVFNNTLYLAWVAEATSTIDYATMPLSTGAWSSAAPTSISTSVAPALGVYAISSGEIGERLSAGLYMAVASGGTLSMYDWDDGWTPVSIPGLPTPPGPLTPALVNTATICNGSSANAPFSALSLVYSYPDAGTSFDEIYVDGLSTASGKSCPIPEQ